MQIITPGKQNILRTPGSHSLFLTIATMLLSVSLYSQSTRPGEVVGNQVLQRDILRDTSNARIEDTLIKLALKSPIYKESEHQNKIDEYQLKGAKNSWLNLLSISANYNETTFNKQDPSSTYVYPKYFTGVTIPLGIIFSRTNIKAAREQVEISKNRQEQLNLNIREQILGKYHQYLILNQLIINQQTVVDDFQATYEKAKTKVDDGSLTIEQHNLASKNYNDENAKLLNLQLQQNLLKLDIEKIIGTNLDSILYPGTGN